jgi:hypothetical protein
LPIVPNQIPHEDIEDIIIHWHGLAKTWHPSFLFAIPINGQRFLARDNDPAWTVPRRPH